MPSALGRSATSASFCNKEKLQMSRTIEDIKSDLQTLNNAEEAISGATYQLRHMNGFKTFTNTAINRLESVTELVENAIEKTTIELGEITND
jgi:hypothetical protein